jgi:hypothetical protein
MCPSTKTRITRTRKRKTKTGVIRNRTGIPTSPAVSLTTRW